MRRVLAGIGGIVVICAALVGALRTISRAAPPPHIAVLLPDDECRPPCWQGLRPGEVDTDVFDQWAAARAPDWHIEWVPAMGPAGHWHIQTPGASFGLTIDHSVNQPIDDSITLDPDSLPLGDLIAALGEPDYVDFYDGSGWLVFHLYYAPERLIVDGTLVWSGGLVALRPDQPVSALRYEAQPWARPVVAYDWRGLGSLERYFPGGLTQ